jgi:hypothetical protein
MEAVLCSSFDWNGIRQPYMLATENDNLNGISMLRISVNMHNVPKEQIFRPSAWTAFGMDSEGPDDRAFPAFTPLQIGGLRVKRLYRPAGFLLTCLFSIFYKIVQQIVWDDRIPDSYPSK